MGGEETWKKGNASLNGGTKGGKTKRGRKDQRVQILEVDMKLESGRPSRGDRGTSREKEAFLLLTI